MSKYIIRSTGDTEIEGTSLKIISGSSVLMSAGSTGISLSGSISVSGSLLVNGSSAGSIIKKENVTLTSGSWVSASLYVYTYIDSDIANSSSIVDFTPNTASFNTVVDAIVYPTVTITAGSASFYATNQPTNNITGELIITNI